MHILKSQTLNDESLLQFARSLGRDLLSWDFGPIMEMKFDREAKNYLFSDESVPLHWDGAFFKEPSKLLFYCTESEGEGGETVFVNTEMIWEDLSEEEKKMCCGVRMIYKTEKLSHYGGLIDVPLVQTHPVTGKTIMRMAEKVETKLNPVELRILGTNNEEGFYQFMVSKLYDPKYQYVHRWEKGDLVVCDNFTYLHGRKSLGQNRKRTFKRIQIL
jgi:alpha-ketoglutarate-dependent taurine dioxygenase